MLNQLETYIFLENISDQFKSKNFNIKNFTILNNHLGMDSDFKSFMSNTPSTHGFYNVYSNNIPFSKKNKMYATKIITDLSFSSFISKIDQLKKTNSKEATLFQQDLSFFVLEYKKAIVERNFIYEKEILKQKSLLNHEKETINNLSQSIKSLTLIEKVLKSFFNSKYKKDINYLQNAPKGLQEQFTQISLLNEQISLSKHIMNDTICSFFLDNESYSTFLDESLPKQLDSMNTLYKIFKEYFPKSDLTSLFSESKKVILSNKLLNLFDTLDTTDYSKTHHLFAFSEFTHNYSHDSFKLLANQNCEKYEKLYLDEYSSFKDSIVSITRQDEDFYLSNNLFFPFSEYKSKSNVLLNHIYLIISEFATQNPSCFEIYQIEKSGGNDFKIIIHDPDKTKLFFNALNNYFIQEHHNLRHLFNSYEHIPDGTDFISKNIREQELFSIMETVKDNQSSTVKKKL